ncbi:MAG: hypothetical protein NC489_09055 [Ruminococcus flavefaciens]|nr:hypothetical protein [Ruminococcus flavefaciens]
MLGGSITLLVWSGIFLAMTITVSIFACRFLLSARKTRQEAEKMIKLTEQRLQKQYNRIATLPYDEFQQYMISSFAKSLEIVSYREVSKSDPDGTVTLYTLAVAEMIEYMGLETVDAIEYYYGKDYIHRWTLLSYELLEKRGVITNVIENKAVRADAVSKSLT